MYPNETSKVNNGDGEQTRIPALKEVFADVEGSVAPKIAADCPIARQAVSRPVRANYRLQAREASLNDLYRGTATAILRDPYGCTSTSCIRYTGVELRQETQKWNRRVYVSDTCYITFELRNIHNAAISFTAV